MFFTLLCFHVLVDVNICDLCSYCIVFFIKQLTLRFPFTSSLFSLLLLLYLCFSFLSFLANGKIVSVVGPMSLVAELIFFNMVFSCLKFCSCIKFLLFNHVVIQFDVHSPSVSQFYLSISNTFSIEISNGTD